MKEYLKHLLIRTPFQRPAQNIQFMIDYRRGRKHPELDEIYREPLRIKQVMQRVIGNSSNCIDIGCYLGSVLSEIIRLSPHGSHIAFEPIPEKARWLKQKFPEVDIREIALSDTSGQVPFYVNTLCSGFSGLHPHHIKDNENCQKIIVKSEKLDHILMPDYSVDFIKLDVEGGELAVLRGAVNTLSRYHPILLFECSRSGLSSFGFTAQQIFEFLTQEQSYAIFLLKDFIQDQKKLNFDQFHRALHYPFQAFNFIACWD